MVSATKKALKSQAKSKISSKKDLKNLNNEKKEIATADLANGPKHEPKEELTLAKTAGGKISEYPVEFTKDSKYFFSCVGTCIKIYNVATGAVVKVLSRSPQAGGHSHKVIRVMLNPKNPLQLYSASLDGTIKLWDYNDEILLKTFNVYQAIQNMIISPSDPEYAYIVVRNKNEHQPKENTAVYRYRLGNEDSTNKRLRKILSMRDCADMTVSPDGKFLVAGGRYKLLVWHMTEGEEDVPSHQLKCYTSAERITTLAFNPVGSCVAVGDTSGRITLYYCFSKETIDHPVTSGLHWHHHPVRALKFLADGAYLLSGGEEAVLVIWQLETLHKQYLPRMGGPITSINVSPNHKYYCLGLADNSIRLVNSISQTIHQVIQGLQYAQMATDLNKLTTGLMIEPHNHHIVLNGIPGAIQFFNTYADQHVMDLEVAPINRVSRAGEKEMVRSHVEHVAFLPRGEWMATVDMRDDKETTMELYLKFWQWDPSTQTYLLHTRVDNPHSKAVTSITFNPALSRHGPMAITTSIDKTFKVWCLTSNLGRNYDKGEIGWTCRSIGVYRDYEPQAAAFSDDGSILAVAFGPIITLWDPFQNTIQGILATSDVHHVTKLHFLPETPYLVSVTNTTLAVWNILTCSVWWEYNMSIEFFSVDSSSGRFSVIHSEDDKREPLLITFEGKSPIPVLVQSMKHGCLGLAYIPRDDGDRDVLAANNIVYLSDRYDLNILSTVPKGSATMAINAKTAIASPLDAANEKSMLNDIFGQRDQHKAQAAEQREQSLNAASVARAEAINLTKDEVERSVEDEALLGAPSHVLPSVDAVFENFMTSLMDLRVTTDEDRSMDIDVEGHAVNTSKDIQSDVERQQNYLESPTNDLEEFKSLNVYFASILSNTSSKRNIFMSPSQLTFYLEDRPTVDNESSSEDEDTDEDDDPSKIDW
ncbi:WD repeat-containing protein 75 [Apophysomyces ossiformis]|uniref:WD repeat-containing protein 75 n=1 Tax=Apophysomyces ossiformis TaxID=679940 RepID=A0A8H7BS11_9FUNG|nr:WD repeat-containing protein 75 [Apophysomyces ossiformis]